MSYRADYHVHTHFSADSEEKIPVYIEMAQKKGLQEICFTDHYDHAFPFVSSVSGKSWACDIASMQKEIDTYIDSPIKIRKGVEMGLRTEDDILPETIKYIQQFNFDFIIASVHLVNGIDPYFPSFFDGHSRSEGFALYVRTLLDCLQQTNHYSSVGHFDYPSKGCPYPDSALHYTDAPDELDSLFRHVIQNGKFVEINTSILKRPEARPRDIEIWKRYAQLGGEAVTIGSDAHAHEFLGYEFDDTRAFLQEAGIHYFVTFDQMVPIYHSIEV